MTLKELIEGISSNLYLRFCRDEDGGLWGESSLNSYYDGTFKTEDLQRQFEGYHLCNTRLLQVDHLLDYEATIVGWDDDDGCLLIVSERL